MEETEQQRFVDWYRLEHGRLLATLVAVTGEPDVALDATDEAFVRAYERWRLVGAMESPAGWTYRVALNVTGDACAGGQSSARCCSGRRRRT